MCSHHHTMILNLVKGRVTSSKVIEARKEICNAGVSVNYWVMCLYV